MLRRNAWTATGVLLLGLAVALVPVTAASASKHKPPHHKVKKSKSKGKSSSNVGSLNCPKQSVITLATGTPFTGPSSQNGGTAACIYSNAAGDDLNVIFDAPSESKSQFVSTDPADIGQPAQALSGVGKAAFTTTTYGHAEVSVYESSSKGFGVTLDPANGGTVTPADLTDVEAVAHALVKG